jgi:hypothetical protein
VNISAPVHRSITTKRMWRARTESAVDESEMQLLDCKWCSHNTWLPMKTCNLSPIRTFPSVWWLKQVRCVIIVCPLQACKQSQRRWGNTKVDMKRDHN